MKWNVRIINSLLIHSKSWYSREKRIASFCHLKICKYLKYVTPFCQQDMQPANEMMAPLPFTASKTMFEFVGIQLNVTVTYVFLVELQCARELKKAMKRIWGREQKMK